MGWELTWKTAISPSLRPYVTDREARAHTLHMALLGLGGVLLVIGVNRWWFTIIAMLLVLAGSMLSGYRVFRLAASRKYPHE